MTSDEIKLSAALAEQTLANIGLTPAAVRKPESWQFMTAGRMETVAVKQKPNTQHKLAPLVEGTAALKQRLQPYTATHGMISSICRRAGYVHNPVRKIMAGNTNTVELSVQNRINAILDEMEADQ